MPRYHVIFSVSGTAAGVLEAKNLKDAIAIAGQIRVSNIDLSFDTDLENQEVDEPVLTVEEVEPEGEEPAA